MQDNSVHTAELQNDAVTTEKIDPYAVTYNRMQHMSNDLTVLGRWDSYTGQTANHVPS